MITLYSSPKKILLIFYLISLAGVLTIVHGQTNIVHGNLIQFSSNGAWCWYQDERAVVDTTNDKIIVASNQTSSGHDFVNIYNITSGTTQNYDLGYIGSDDHDTPGLLIRPDGKYIAMYSKHNGDKITHYKIFNNNSWSSDKIFDWNTQPGGADFNTTYSNVYFLSTENRTYNLSRGNGHGGQNFIVSSDYGDTWSYGGFLTTNADIGYVNGYFKYCSNGVDRIDFVCTEYHPRDFNTSVYHGYIKNGQTFKSDGTVVDTNIFDKNPTSPQDYTPVFQANTELNGLTLTHCWNTDVQRYDDGTIATIVTARTNTDSNNPTHAFIYCRYDGIKWSATYLGNAGLKLYYSEEDYTGLAAMHPETPDIIYISSTYDPRDNTFLKKHEIFKGITKDKGATWEWTPITENSTVDNLRPIVPKWENYKTVLIWFRGTYYSAQNINAEIVGIITDEETTLPVELSNFYANVKNNFVELNWETKSEINNNGFEIERFKNNKWNAIGFKKGNGTTNYISKYTFVDRNVSENELKYRLKQIDFDGSFTYSKILEVKTNIINDYFLGQNYPNPFNPTTKINYSISSLNLTKGKAFVQLKVYDTLGNEIATLVNKEQGSGEYYIDFDADKYKLPSGIYFYTIKIGNFTSTKKMILLK